MYNNQFQGMIQLRIMKRIEYMLIYIYIGTIPSSLGCLTLLTILTLQNNDLSGNYDYIYSLVILYII